MKKAQMALEFLFIILIALVILGPTYFFTFSKSSDNIAVSKAQSAIDTVGRNIDYVYSLNIGSVVAVSVDIPNGIISYNVTNRTIYYTVSTSVGPTDTFYTAKASVTGMLPTNEGRHTVILNNTGGGVTIA